MRYTGQSYECEPTYLVTDSVLTDNRISLDWDENGVVGHLEATSADGQTFAGTFGYPQLDPSSRVTFTRYRSKEGAVVLIGHWTYLGGAEEGDWVIRLEPTR
jgi:hypothetical protein